MKLDLSPESWGRVILSTVFGTAVCVAAAVYVDSFNFADMDDAGRLRALLTDVLLPTVLAVPLLLFFTGKLRELAIAHRRLTVFASTDALTQVMNRAAFSTLVDAYLTEVHAAATRAHGALLIIDADDFKAVNDRYGHDRGDEALIAIAQSIRATIANAGSGRPPRRRGVRRLPAGRQPRAGRSRRRAHTRVGRRCAVHARGARSTGCRSVSGARCSSRPCPSPICSVSPTSSSMPPSSAAGTAFRSAPTRTAAVSPRLSARR